jgi:hypothetical protein
MIVGPTGLMIDSFGAAVSASRVHQSLDRTPNRKRIIEMSINVQCDSCNSSFKVKDEFAGKRGKCPTCGVGVQVPHLPKRRTEIAEPQTAQIVHAGPAPPQLIAIQQRVEVHKEETNGLGTAGFVVSLVGVLTCGFLSPVGFLFSLIALFKPPRGMAIAGAVLGGLGSL